MRHEIQGSGDEKGLAGWPTGCLICRRRGLLNYHACIGELALSFVRWHSAIFLLRRLAALDVSQDDYSSTLVAVGFTGLRAQRDDVTSYSDDCLSGALDILPRCSPHPAEEREWCFHISDALNLLSKTISSELFYFLCGADLNVAEPVKHTQSFFFMLLCAGTES